ncbi:MAG: hypothetical protein RLZZ422_1959 [Pseudomonadota bacterium]|jgi:hypothetical protein
MRWRHLANSPPFPLEIVIDLDKLSYCFTFCYAAVLGGSVYYCISIFRGTYERITGV